MRSLPDSAGSRRGQLLTLLAIAPVVTMIPSLAAGADEIRLTDGGRVYGTVTSDGAQGAVIVRTENGLELTLDKALVIDIKPESPEHAAYRNRASRFPRTSNGHVELAEWCRQNQLANERERHLLAALELDPNHARARTSLGYERVGDEWLTLPERKARQGLYYHNRRWRTRQEIELLESTEEQEQAEKRLLREIKNWRKLAERSSSDILTEQLSQLDNPQAVPALSQLLGDEANFAVIKLYIRTLGRIGTGDAKQALAYQALHHANEEIRLSCLDELAANDHASLSVYFVKALASADNAIVNRSARAIEELAISSAVEPLIRAVVTYHKRKVQPRQTGNTNVGFGTGPNGGGGGLSVGGSGPRVIEQRVENPAVVDALKSLTGVNFRFNQAEWASWLRSRTSRGPVNLRRG